MRVLWLAGVALWTTVPATGQQVAVPVATSVQFAPGTLTERVASSLNRSQHYAVYLPSAYRADRPWPVLLLLDPRGRALLPMRLVRESAERLGYVVLSSWNTLSDWDNQPNLDAMSAMLTDVQRLFAVDRSRFYLMGFSGTARFSWEQAAGLRGVVAGVLGFGAGLPPGFHFVPPGTSGPPPFDFFGGAGTRDFNYEELLGLDPELDRQGMVHRIRFYDGPHGWPPMAVAAEGLDWMELRAMHRGLAPTRLPWIDSLFVRAMARGDALVQAGDSLWALRQFRAVAADFGGLRDVERVAARVDSLARSRAVRAALKTEAAIVRRNREYLARLVDFLRRYRGASKPPSVKEGLRTLEISRLRQEQGDTRDTVRALAAGRLLSHVLAATGFYEPRDYLVEGDSLRARGMLEIAAAVRPNPDRPPEVAFRELVDEVRRGAP